MRWRRSGHGTSFSLGDGRGGALAPTARSDRAALSPNRGEGGLRLEAMLRVFLLQSWDALRDRMTAEMLRYSGALSGSSRAVTASLTRSPSMISATPLERCGLTEAIFAEVNDYLDANGFTLRRCIAAHHRNSDRGQRHNKSRWPSGA